MATISWTCSGEEFRRVIRFLWTKLPSFPTETYCLLVRVMCWLRNDSAACQKIGQNAREWPNGHPWRWQHRSARLKDGRESSRTGKLILGRWRDAREFADSTVRGSGSGCLWLVAYTRAQFLQWWIFLISYEAGTNASPCWVNVLKNMKFEWYKWATLNVIMISHLIFMTCVCACVRVLFKNVVNFWDYIVVGEWNMTLRCFLVFVFTVS
jgi:hypothetical protein